jgi:hypothetical protein
VSRVCLVIVFNHRFEANLDKLDQIYGERFPDRVHVMPFYEGDRTDVIPVLESSFCFQGYLAQAFPQFAADDVTHYVFAADDLMLHPSLNSENIVAELGLDTETAYIKSLTGIGNQPLLWPHLRRGLTPFLERNGVDWQPLLPSETEAFERLSEHGVELGAHHWRDLRDARGRIRLRRRPTRWAISYLAGGRGKRIPPYPLAVAYSDFFVLPAGSAEPFMRYSGVLAAMGVFVEVAIPTALLLTAPHVRTEADTHWRGKEVWTRTADADILAEHDASFPRLLQGFAADQLYLHPVKLSKWKGPFA